MGLLLSTRRALLGGVGSYNDLVLGTGPIAYWPQDEASGTTARCLVNPAQNGTYTAVTLADDLTGPFGMPAPLYDGATSFCTIISAALIAAWDGDTGGVGVWARIFNAGIYGDFATRAIIRLCDAGGPNEAAIPKHTVANQFRWRTKRNNVFVGTITAETSVAWELWSMSWDANNFYLYRSGTLRATVPLVQPWSNPIATAFLGASSAVPGWPWHGWLGPAMIYDYTVPQTTWEALSL